MHILSTVHRLEFLGIPELVRASMVATGSASEPTLLVKASSLSLKYICLADGLKGLLCFPLDGGLAYAIAMADDPEDSPALVWSLAESQEEIDFLKMAVAGTKVEVFLFNELVVNVAWSSVTTFNDSRGPRRWLEEAKPLPSDSGDHMNRAKEYLQRIQHQDAGESLQIGIASASPWRQVPAHYYTDRGTISTINITDPDEGGQQEEAALWLTDGILGGLGAIRSPQVLEGRKRRELTDIFLPSEHGSVLIESKALSILNRAHLPSRRKLTRDVSGHVKKARAQLNGAIRSLRRGLTVTSPAGQSIFAERTQVPHCLILVPDLSLLSEEGQYGREFLLESSREIGALLQILDLFELLRVVQGAEMISESFPLLSAKAALDRTLTTRFEIALTSPTPNVRAIFR